MAVILVIAICISFYSTEYLYACQSPSVYGKMGKPGSIEGFAAPDKSALEDQPMNGLSWISQFGDSSMGASVSIYELAARTLAKLGVSVPATAIQSMLMKDGYFVGHKLRYDGGYAIYLAGSNIIEFYDEGGTLLTMAALDAETAAA